MSGTISGQESPCRGDSECEDEGTGAGHNSSNSSAADSGPELVCAGCDIGSKAPDPVEVKKLKLLNKKVKKPELVRVRWAKSTTRKVVGKHGTKKKVKRVCGEWCRICWNIIRKRLQVGKYKKAEQKQKRSGLKLL